MEDKKQIFYYNLLKIVGSTVGWTKSILDDPYHFILIFNV